MARNLNHYPANPSYGSGTFRRRFILSREGERRTVALLDDYHTMSATLTLSDGVVTDVSASMERFPKTTCPGAATALEALRGKPVSSHSALLRGVDRGGHCTHLIDMAGIALSWPVEDGETRVIEVAVRDKDPEQRQQVQITVDGISALSLEMREDAIETPAAHRGRKIFGGYARWVEETFPPQEASLWLIAQMAMFVAVGRGYIVGGPIARTTGLEEERKGACFSYSDPSFDIARDNVGYVRDYSGGLPPPVGAAGKAAQGILK